MFVDGNFGCRVLRLITRFCVRTGEYTKSLGQTCGFQLSHYTHSLRETVFGCLWKIDEVGVCVEILCLDLLVLFIDNADGIRRALVRIEALHAAKMQVMSTCPSAEFPGP